MSSVPVNFRRSEATAAEAEEAADYAIAGADNFLWHIGKSEGVLGPDANRPLDGVSLLEIGPGRSLGAALMLACAGARVTVADRFMPSWDEGYHPRVFAAMLEKVRARGEAFTQPILDVLRAGSFTPALTGHALGAEKVAAIDGVFDVILSNAVLEHIEDLQATVQNLAVKTAPGGIGVHQIDMRDHRDFSRPLEFLTLPAEELADLRRRTHCECGGAWRASDVAQAFDGAGFDVVIEPNMEAAPEYVADVRRRLQPEYAVYGDRELATVCALFLVRRRATVAIL